MNCHPQHQLELILEFIPKKKKEINNSKTTTAWLITKPERLIYKYQPLWLMRH